ncbi:snare associated Golgi protein-domain-containing protein, partial [Cubamyces lactineus]
MPPAWQYMCRDATAAWHVRRWKQRNGFSPPASCLPYGWTIPIGILFVISFPPLFGHEIVAILCGLVWGLWAGFGIVAAGTFIGEVGNFYAFKYCCAARGEKLEKSKLSYACLARVVRDGGFKIALIARLSAIPGHFTTAVFSTCGMSIWTFSIAAVLSLPKQFIT